MSQPEFDYLGPYRVERTLGRGGMGTVYKGVHAKSGEAVAIKVIASGVANQSRFRRRFAAEVETLKRLKHPNIVGLVGYGEEQGLLFYSMEYVDGHSLHDHLRQHSQLPWEDVIEVGIQTTAALKHAHDLGIIHRDLKPANLMLHSDGKIKLTDFGIAKLFGSTDMTAAGSVIGTADYMPPEQAEGKPVTAKSDLYSLGGVMYALLCGKAPFSGKSVPEVLYSVRYNPVPQLKERLPELPTELCELVHDLLEKEPSKRPPTALVVGNRLKSLQQGLKNLAESKRKSGGTDSASLPEKIPPHLTSLDLSDVEDDELKLTSGDGETSIAAGGSNGADVVPDEADPIGTHEQQTMLAPDGYLPGAAADGDAAEKKQPSSDVDQAFSHASSLGSASRASQLAQDEPITAGGPSHYTPISEGKGKPFSFGEEDLEPQVASVDWIHYGSIAGIIALLLGSVGLGWWLLQPNNADEIYQEISQAADSGDDARLLGTKASIDEFLDRFPNDERASEIKALADEIELARWTRVLQRRASRSGGSNELTAIEQAFLECMQARYEDTDLANEKLTAFLAVFDQNTEMPRDEARLVELAQFAMNLGNQREKITPVAVAQLEELIQNAEEQLVGDALQAYYQSLVVLYGEKPWAKEQLKRLRVKLESDE